MRGKISDQDLTNYALNDGLDARERLYVESMLGISEECRGDVYRALDLAQMLETGFEAQGGGEENLPCLTAAQRASLLAPQPTHFSPRLLLRRSAATLAIAACVALALANPQMWRSSGHRGAMAAVSSEVSRMVAQAISSQEEDIANYVNPPTVNEDDSGTFIQTAIEPMPQAPTAVETVCTPPSWQSADLTEIH